ncbi:halocyanin domain-containing protein [Haloplanus halophilus]|uniref:halocyanin domain-containing protein n=1 Tax=Haloplanus halophilus TaxID=2949993 RepID=UPI002040AF2C|nr:halocyanin domain-containing protein [Haloplanus sp. GDY1]
MHDPSDWSRREFVVASLAGTGALAGCTARGQPADDTSAAADESSGCLDDWLADANGYEGVIERYAPDQEVTVTVGESLGAGHTDDAFGPAAVRVVPGTTVTWEWSGHGDPANVVAVDGAFDSGEPVGVHGYTFSHTFDETGTYRYVSEPTREAGMVGAVVVADPPSSGYPAVDEWLAGVNVYDGTVVDWRDHSSPLVTVGSAEGESEFTFSPPAVRVSTGTTVRWVWTGGPHAVAFEDVDVESDVHTEPGVRFEHTFAEAGVYRYACAPHHALGAKGAVVVE